MTWLLILTAVLFSSLRGIREGMTMIQSIDQLSYLSTLGKTEFKSYPDTGVRTHKWFRWYHLISVIELVAAMAVGAELYAQFPNIVTCGGLFILSWEIVEIWYAYARFHVFITGHENFLGLGINIDKVPVITWHVLRTVAGCALIIGGMV